MSRPRGADGKALYRVRLDWFPVVFWLTAGQWRATARLYDAMYDAARGEVDEGELLRASKGPAASVRSLFAGSDALNRIVLPGARPGTYRLTPKPEGSLP